MTFPRKNGKLEGATGECRHFFALLLRTFPKFFFRLQFSNPSSVSILYNIRTVRVVAVIVTAIVIWAISVLAVLLALDELQVSGAN